MVVVVVVVVVVDIVSIEGVVLAKVIEEQVLHYAKYLTGNIDSTGSRSSSSSSGNRRHNLSRGAVITKRTGTSLCEVPAM